MEPCAITPGMLFHIVHRAHMNAVQSAISAAGLGDLGAPMILMLLRDWDQGREAPAQRELADAFHVTPATIAMSLKSLSGAAMWKKPPIPGTNAANGWPSQRRGWPQWRPVNRSSRQSTGR